MLTGLAAVMLLGEPDLLNHGAHGTVNNKNTLGKRLPEAFKGGGLGEALGSVNGLSQPSAIEGGVWGCAQSLLQGFGGVVHRELDYRVLRLQIPPELAACLDSIEPADEPIGIESEIEGQKRLKLLLRQQAAMGF